MLGPSCIPQFLINYKAYTTMATSWYVPFICKRKFIIEFWLLIEVYVRTGIYVNRNYWKYPENTEYKV
jgi:hypothetical protein